MQGHRSQTSSIIRVENIQEHVLRTFVTFSLIKLSQGLFFYYFWFGCASLPVATGVIVLFQIDIYMPSIPVVLVPLVYYIK